MQVTPAIQREPAIVTVPVTVETSVDNRMLQVTAKSPVAARTSQVAIDGANDAVALKVFESSHRRVVTLLLRRCEGDVMGRLPAVSGRRR